MEQSDKSQQVLTLTYRNFRQVVIILMLFIIILCRQSAYAKFFDGKNFVPYEKGNSISYENILTNKSAIEDAFKKLNYKCEYLLSQHEITGIRGYTYKGYIVMATHSGYVEALQIAFHEIAHQRYGNRVKEYSKKVYGEQYKRYDKWENQLEEELAEDFKVYCMEKYYSEICGLFDVEKNTTRKYNRSKVSKFFD